MDNFTKLEILVDDLIKGFITKYKKFKKDEKHEYAHLVILLNQMFYELNYKFGKKLKGTLHITLHKNPHKVIYNSASCNNTYDDYANNEIKCSKHITKAALKAEQHGIYVNYIKEIISKKIGSTITISNIPYSIND